MVNFRQNVRAAGGRLALCGVSPRLMQILRTCSLERLFTIHRTRPDAVRAAR
jgi:anti-anti-sigma regulatory factor